MGIDDLIQRLKELKKEGADRVYIRDRSSFGRRYDGVSKVERDREGDAAIS